MLFEKKNWIFAMKNLPFMGGSGAKIMEISMLFVFCVFLGDAFWTLHREQLVTLAGFIRDRSHLTPSVNLL